MREKQIEEMAKVIANKTALSIIEATGIAEILTAEDYCKQIEAEWIKYPDEHFICATEFVCSNCRESYVTSEMTDEQFLETTKYCPNCGAKMKGADHEQRKAD